MEVAAGVETLIVAVFHYCECYSARLHDVKNLSFLPSSGDDETFSHFNHWDCYKSYAENIIDRCIKIRPHAYQLIQDPARTKHAEMVASQLDNLRPTPEKAWGDEKSVAFG